MKNKMPDVNFQKPNLQEIKELLEKLGVSLFNEYGQYRSIFDIVEEIATKWEEMKKCVM